MGSNWKLGLINKSELQKVRRNRWCSRSPNMIYRGCLDFSEKQKSLQKLLVIKTYFESDRI